MYGRGELSHVMYTKLVRGKVTWVGWRRRGDRKKASRDPIAARCDSDREITPRKAQVSRTIRARMLCRNGDSKVQDDQGRTVSVSVHSGGRVTVGWRQVDSQAVSVLAQARRMASR